MRNVIEYCYENENMLSDSLSDTPFCIQNDNIDEWEKTFFSENNNSPIFFRLTPNR